MLVELDLKVNLLQLSTRERVSPPQGYLGSVNRSDRQRDQRG